ncbi:hypothetical protein GJ632_06045 [Halogeometricum sp. CBA1124]|nr:hypothetical protein [Halogeometricum sp. CBA1124]
MRSVIVACMSSAAVTGTSGPTASRTDARSAPSGSGSSSTDIDPWRSRQTPSTVSLSRRARNSARTHSNASRSTVGPGSALAPAVGSISASASASVSTIPPSDRPTPSASGRSVPVAVANDSIPVVPSANVFVSWLIAPTATLMGTTTRPTHMNGSPAAVRPTAAGASGRRASDYGSESARRPIVDRRSR